MFKNKCVTAKTNGTKLTIPDQRLELYADPNITTDLSNGHINILNTQTLEIDKLGTSPVVFYPFVLDHSRYTIFNLKYGGTLKLKGVWSGQDIQGKLETYNITFRVGGDLKKIQVNGEVRSGFWENMAQGDAVFVNHAFETLGEERTIDTWDAETGIITLVEDLTYGSMDLNNQYTTGGFIFNEDVSFADYQTYGQFWIYDTHRCYFIYSIPPNETTPPKANIVLTDFSIYGFARQTMFAVANGELKINGTVTYERNEIGLNFFSRGAANYQKLDFVDATLQFFDSGTYAGGSITAITADDILGSGAYIHPNVIVRGTTLNLWNNIGTAFRQYSFGGNNPIVLGDEEYQTIIDLIDCVDNIEADFRSSNLIPTTIGELRNSTYVNLHYETTINAGKITAGYINPNETNAQATFVTNVVLNDVEIDIQDETLFAIGGNLTCNNCNIHVRPIHVNAPHIFDVIDGNPDVKLIGCTFTPDATLTSYTPGAAENGSPVQGKAILFVGNIPDETKGLSLGLIDSCTVDGSFWHGYIFKEDDGWAQYIHRNRKIHIKDCDLRISRLSDYTYLREHFTWQVEVENARVNSPRMIQSISERPFVYKPRTTSVSKSIVDGVIEFDFENEINVTGGGTLHTLFPVLYNGASKINSSISYNGTIRLNAVGASFTIQNTGNINESITVNAGEYIELTASRDIIGTQNTTSRLMGTSDGTLAKITGTLAADVGLDHRFIEVVDITSDEVATLNEDGTINGTNTSGVIDVRTGSYDIIFATPLDNEQTVTLNYKYYSGITFKGVWA